MGGWTFYTSLPYSKWNLTTCDKNILKIDYDFRIKSFLYKSDKLPLGSYWTNLMVCVDYQNKKKFFAFFRYDSKLDVFGFGIKLFVNCELKLLQVL
jgi:hypothetical protein